MPPTGVSPAVPTRQWPPLYRSSRIAINNPSCRASNPELSQPGPDTVEHTDSVDITNLAPAEGTFHALMSWSGSPARDSLYQQFYLSSTVSSVTVNYWYAVTTDETVPGYDFFCASLQKPDETILVDLGCMDAVDTDAYWHEAVYSLNSSEPGERPWPDRKNRLRSIQRQLTRLIRLGRLRARLCHRRQQLPRSIRMSLTTIASTATTLACGQTITSGIIGDAVGGADVDWFRLSNVPAGRLNLDIDARTQVPPSDLDSVVYLYDNNLNVVAYNDDDGITFDSLRRLHQHRAQSHLLCAGKFLHRRGWS